MFVSLTIALQYYIQSVGCNLLGTVAAAAVAGKQMILCYGTKELIRRKGIACTETGPH